MKEKTKLQPLFVAILLILAGTLSPSNGVDDRSYKTPLELITTIFTIVSAGLTLHFAWKWIEQQGEPSKTNYKSKEEKYINL
jgi:preprotein translocase subunit SecY